MDSEKLRQFGGLSPPSPPTLPEKKTNWVMNSISSIMTLAVTRYGRGDGEGDCSWLTNYTGMEGSYGVAGQTSLMMLSGARARKRVGFNQNRS